MNSRRNFLKDASLLSVNLAALGFAKVSQAAGEVQITEADPTASALGYRHESSKVDQAKYPNHKLGQLCSGCSLVQGKDGEAWRPCGLFPGKLVDARGWCAAFAPKA